MKFIPIEIRRNEARLYRLPPGVDPRGADGPDETKALEFEFAVARNKIEREKKKQAAIRAALKRVVPSFIRKGEAA